MCVSIISLFLYKVLLSLLASLLLVSFALPLTFGKLINMLVLGMLFLILLTHRFTPLLNIVITHLVP
jgi:hypothetical protein